MKSSGIELGYNLMTINYFDTSVERLYKIDDGDWISYQDKKIKLQIHPTAQKISIKGKDKNNKETKTVEYTATLPSDSLKLLAYNGDESDYEVVGRGATVYIDIDSSMYGKQIYVKTNNNYVYYTPLDKDGNSTASQVQGPKDGILMTVPEGTTKLKINVSASSSNTNFYEIRPVNE